jgi:putative transposase
MARLPRYALPGLPQHVIQRGNDRSALFVTPADYRFFRESLADASTRHFCQIHAFVFMMNHVHLLMTPSTGSGIGKFMQSVGCRYVYYFNRTYGRTGTLWEGRYRATPIDTERYLLTCYPLHRAQSGAGGPGERCCRLSLVQLSNQCSGTARFAHHTP